MARTRALAELSEISHDGAVAGRTSSAVLIVTGIGVIAASWAALWQRCGEIAGECVSRSAGAALFTMASMVGVGVGVGIWWRIRRRPVKSSGSSRYVWAIGLLFAFGLVLAASRIPAYTCERGRFDNVLELCMHPPTVSEPARWMFAKEAVVGLGLLGGVGIVARPRWIRVTAPLGALAWFGGAGWVVVETILRPST